MIPYNTNTKQNQFKTKEQEQRQNIINQNQSRIMALDPRNFKTISYSPQKNRPLYQKYDRNRLNLPISHQNMKKSEYTKLQQTKLQVNEKGKMLDDRRQAQQLRRELKRVNQQYFYQKGKLQSQVHYHSCLANQSKENYLKLDFNFKELENENTALKKQIQQYKIRDSQQNNWKKTRLQEAQMKARELNEDLHEASRIISVLKNQLIATNTRYESEVMHLNQIIVHYQQGLRDKTQLEVQNKEMKMILEQQQRKRSKEEQILKQQIDNEKRKQFFRLQQLQDVKNEADYLRKEVATLNIQINEIREDYFMELRKLETKLRDAQQVIVNLKNQNANTYKSLEGELKKYKSELEQNNRNNGNKDKLISELKETLEVVRRKHQDQTMLSDTTRNQLIRDLQKIKREKIIITNELQSLHLKFTALNSQYHYLRENFNKISYELENCTMQNGQLQRFLAQIKHKDQLLQQQLESAHHAINRKQELNYRTKQQINKFHNKAEQMLEEKQMLRVQNAILKEQTNTLLARCQDLDLNYLNMYRRGFQPTLPLPIGQSPPRRVMIPAGYSTQRDRISSVNNRRGLSTKRETDGLNKTILQRCRMTINR